jgi:response regulator of citrate/malate metabolism
MIGVLVVDDDYMVAGMHAAFVSHEEGFTVVGVAHSGADAVRMVADLRPDLVLLDIHLPDVNGIEVLRRLRDSEPDVDVLVISAANEVDTVRTALRGGVVNYLLKPFDREALRHRLRQYAEAHVSLAATPTIAQRELDQIFGGSTRPGSPATRSPGLPKGLSPESAALVRRALRESDAELSAMECAQLTGLSRVSARRYLEYFTQTGQAEVRLRYGSAGRPERRYAWRVR